MKQKIVIKVALDSDKCRSKALKIAAVAKGVSSVSLEGKDKDEVVVTGEEVDSVCLARVLRKKFRHADIVTVQEVKDEDKEKKKEESKLPLYYYNQCPPWPIPYQVVYDQSPDNCTIL